MTPAGQDDSPPAHWADLGNRPPRTRVEAANQTASGGLAGDAVATLVCDPPTDIDLNFDDFFMTNFSKLRALLFARSRDWTLAEDAAQETMIICHRKWSDISDTRPDVFAVKVGRRLQVKTQMAMAKRQEEPFASLEPLVHVARGVLTSVGADDALIDRIMVEGAIRAVTVRQAEVIILFYKFGYTNEMIAQELGIRPGTVKSHLHAARSKMAELLSSSTGEEVRHIA
jgi:RNA polymerase sigma factor (sigma-70 family)